MRPPKTALLAPLASILATVQLVQALKFITPKELVLGQEVTIEWIGQPSLGTVEQAVVLIKNEVPLLILCQGLITGSGKCTFTLSNSDGQSFIGDGYHLGLRASDGLVLDVSKPFNIKGNPKDKDTKRAKSDKNKDKGKAKDKDEDDDKDDKDDDKDEDDDRDDKDDDRDEDDDRDDKDDDRDEDDDDNDHDEEDRDDDDDDNEVRIQGKKHKGKQHQDDDDDDNDDDNNKVRTQSKKHKGKQHKDDDDDDDDDDDKEDGDEDRDEDEVNAVENMKIHKHSVGSAAEMSAPQSLDATQHQVSLQYIDDSQGLVIASVRNPTSQKLERPFPRRVRPRKAFTPPLRKRFTKYRALVEARRQERVMAADKGVPSKVGADDFLVSIDPVTIKGLHGDVEVMPSQNDKEHKEKGSGANKKEHDKKKHSGDDSTNDALGKKEHEKSKKESKYHPVTNKDGAKSSRGKTGDRHGSHASKKMIEVEEAGKKVEPKAVSWGQWLENVGTAISSGLDRIKQTFSDKHPDQQRTDTKEGGHRHDEKSDKEKRAQTQETLQRGSLGEDL